MFELMTMLSARKHGKYIEYYVVTIIAKTTLALMSRKYVFENCLKFEDQQLKWRFWYLINRLDLSFFFLLYLVAPVTGLIFGTLVLALYETVFLITIFPIKKFVKALSFLTKKVLSTFRKKKLNKSTKWKAE